MAAVPVIMAAVGVASTVASISAQQRQVSAQNAAIDAQISSNKQAEAIRKQSNQLQLAMIADQDRIQRMSRQANFVAERSQLQLLNMQQQAQNLQERTKLSQAQKQFETEADAAKTQLTNQVLDSEQAVREATAQANSQAAQAISQVPDQTNDIKQANQQISTQAANLIGIAGGRGRTSSMQKGLNPDQVAQVLQSISQGQQVSAETLQQLQQSESFNRMMQEVTQLGAAQEQNRIQQGVQTAQRQTNINLRDLTQQNQIGKQQVAGAIRSAFLRNKSENAQADLNNVFARASLITGQGLNAAQAVASSAQLQSQRASGPGALGTLAQLAGAGIPLFQALQSQSSNSSQMGKVFNYNDFTSKNFNSLYQQPVATSKFQPSYFSQVPVKYIGGLQGR